jgi:HPt (histidine-containing phosphotransfer) domain-containing protein
MIQSENFTVTTDEKLYDICMIDRLCRGNQEQVKKMVTVFIKEIPNAIEEIKLAYNNRDFTTVKNTTHRIKPTLSYYAIIKIEKDIRRIEALAKQGQAVPELELKIMAVENVLAAVVEKLKTDFLYNS